MGSVLAFWNWLYDIYAIKADVLRVYTRAYYERRGAEAIATEYAPVFFGVFGFCYGVAIRLAELVLLQHGRADLYWPLLLTFSLLGIVVPVSSYILFSFLAIGESGLRSYEGVHHEG